MEKENTTQMTRRDLLKLLTAGGGALAASAFLPAKWTKPLVETGVLPVHAQASQQPTNVVISGLTANWFNVDSVSSTSGKTSFIPPISFSFTYADPLGQVSNTSSLYASMGGNSTTGTIYSTFAPGGANGTGFAGTIFGRYNPAVDHGTLEIKLIVGGRTSNSLTKTFFLT